VFDTQIAAGLVGYRYPVALRKLVESELNGRMNKSYTVADWETRPFNHKQLRYALDDVLPLYDLWRALEDHLRRYGRTEWAREEFRQLEQEEFYARDPNKEALDSRLMHSLSSREQVFLIRLYDWRRQMAREKNYSKEMVLPNKLMGHIVRTIQSGKDALRNNRRIPDKLAERYGEAFEQLYSREITPEERRLLDRIAHDEAEDPREEILIEMLYLAIKYKCLEENVSPNLVLPRALLKKLRLSAGLVDEVLEESWRGQFLGEHFLNWLRKFDQLEIRMEGGQIRFQLGK
jgi:ribonuclease D